MQVTLYTKPNCSLCEILQGDLVWLQRQISFIVKVQDISTDAALTEQFKYLVPVLEIAGVLYYPPHDLLQLQRALLTAANTKAEN